MRTVLRIIALVLTLAATAALPVAAHAAPPDVNVSIGEPGDQVVVKGAITLSPGERAGTLVSVDGPITIPRGALVRGDVFSVDGDVRIAGTVRGDVVTIGGRATLEPTARVRGQVSWVSHRPVLNAGAQVAGGVDQVDVDWGNAFPFVAWIWWWLAVSISTLVLGLLLLWFAPRAADAVAERMSAGGWGPALGVGFAICVVVPFAAVLALVTLVGVPFGIGLLLALLPLGAVGYVTAAWSLGRAIAGAPRGRAVSLLAGWAILRVLALIPVAGVLAFAVASMYGIGALAVTAWRARSGPLAAGGPEAPTAPAI